MVVSDTSTSSARDALIGALRRIVRPLLRICLRGGISIAEIRAVLDHAAAQEAEAYILSSGKKPTYGNISIITGIERRNVAKLLALPAESVNPPSTTTLHRAVRVLNGWHEDPSFMTRQGTPAELAVRGGPASFEGLARKYAGYWSGSAILDRLIETNTIEVTVRDRAGRPERVRPLQATIAPDVNATRAFEEFGVVYSEALEQFDANLRSNNPIERIRPYSVTATVLKPNLKVLRRDLKERGENLQAIVGDSFEPHDLPQKQIEELAKSDPESLYSVRVTLFTTIRPAIAIKPTVTAAYRRGRPAESKPDAPTPKKKRGPSPKTRR
jgi:hypothetical protein